MIEDELALAGRILSSIADDLYAEARRAIEGRLISVHAVATAQSALRSVMTVISQHADVLTACPRHLHSRGELCFKPLENGKCPDHALIWELRP